MGLIQDLIDKTTDNSEPVANLLRRAKVLAYRLKSDDLANWVVKELNGYKNKDEVPEYRIFTPLNFGQFQGYGGAEIKNAPLPLSFMPDYVQEDYSLHYAARGVHFYEDYFSDPSRTELVYAWDADVIALLQQECSLYPDFVIVAARTKIARSNFAGIFDAVRNRLLELALELQKNYPDSDEDFGKLPNNGISSIVNVAIYGGQQNIASGTNFTQTPTQYIHASNFKELSDTLQKLGVAEQEVEELKAAVELDKSTSQHGQLGENVKRWLGDVSANAVGGGATTAVVLNWPQIAQAVDHFVKHLG